MARFRLPRRTSLIEFLFLLALAFGLFYFFLLPGFHHHHGDPSTRIKPRRKRPDTPLPCSQLSGADDVVVVLKTSAAEIEDRLPVHFDTTLLCYPNYMIFSDYSENYQGYPVHDALATIDRGVQKSHPDFELWRRLRKRGPDALEDEEIWNSDETVKDLDKWKLLPILEQTFVKYPDQKWYVFLETNTFIFWSNLLLWFQKLDHTKPYYIGAQGRIGNSMFAKAGSGIVLSHRAMQSVLKLYQETTAAWNAYTEEQSSGDVILAEALREAGVFLTPAWPVFQSYRPADMEYNRISGGRRLWCHPTISYHGISQSNTVQMWKFEQQWITENVFVPDPSISLRTDQVLSPTNPSITTMSSPPSSSPASSSAPAALTTGTTSAETSPTGRPHHISMSVKQNALRTRNVCSTLLRMGPVSSRLCRRWGISGREWRVGGCWRGRRGLGTRWRDAGMRRGLFESDADDGVPIRHALC